MQGLFLFLFVLLLSIWLYCGIFKGRPAICSYFLQASIVLGFVLLRIGRIVLGKGPKFILFQPVFFVINTLFISSLSILCAGLFFEFFNGRFRRLKLPMALAAGVSLPLCSCHTACFVLLGIEQSDSRFQKALWLFVFLISPMASVFYIAMSIGLLGLRFSVLRVLAAIVFSAVAAVALSGFLRANAGRDEKGPHRACLKEHPNGLFNAWGDLFSRISFPILLSALIGGLFSYFALNRTAAGYALFHTMRLPALLIALAGQFCMGQDLVILKGISEFYRNMGFNLCFSLFASGFCLSMLPIYRSLFSWRGVFLFLVLLIFSGSVLFALFP